MRIPRETREYWESLGIPIDDLTDRQTRLKSRIYTRLKNKLEKQSENWFPTISKSFALTSASAAQALEELDSKSALDFVNLMALAAFADFKISPRIIFGVARSVLGAPYVRRIDNLSIDSNAILLPLFQKKPEGLKQVFYEYLIQRSELPKYVLTPRLPRPIPFERFEFTQIDTFLQKYEQGRRASIRREIKLWWFDKNNGGARLVFRREKNARSQLKLVRTNEYFKTGDEKIFLFTDGGGSLSLLSRREPLRTLRIAEYLVYRLSGFRGNYGRVINQLTVGKLGEFITRLAAGRISGATLVSIKVRNAPVVGSPSLEVSSPDSDVTPSIEDLELSHSLPMLEHPADILGFAVALGQRVVRVRTDVEGDKVTLKLNNRNLREDEKAAVAEFFSRWTNPS